MNFDKNNPPTNDLGWLLYDGEPGNNENLAWVIKVNDDNRRSLRLLSGLEACNSQYSDVTILYSERYEGWLTGPSNRRRVVQPQPIYRTEKLGTPVPCAAIDLLPGQRWSWHSDSVKSTIRKFPAPPKTSVVWAWPMPTTIDIDAINLKPGMSINKKLIDHIDLTAFTKEGTIVAYVSIDDKVKIDI